MAAEAAISSAVEQLGDLLMKKVKFLQGVEGEVELLKDELRRMQCFLEDANRKQVENKQVRNWISEIREVAQDTEDTIEMFLLNVENAKNEGLLRRCTSFPKCMYHLDRIGDEIEKIHVRIKAIEESRQRYGIILPVEANSTRSSQIELRRRLSPWRKDEQLVGIEDDVKKLLRESILNEERKGLSVAVIQGMGGIGKSTLAREIYNHPNVVAGPFDCRAWVVVSSEFTAKETIKQLIMEQPGFDKKELRQLEKSTDDEEYLLRKLQEMLHQQLQGKNYLIVLDDVWEQQHWEALKSAFPIEQDKTSRLLVTSRNKIVTKYDQYEHVVRLLDPEKSWELLLKKANIGDTNWKCPKELESIGRQILEKCDGLPLAISVVGGLLVQTRTMRGWEHVLNQISSYLERGEDSVLQILELSYHNLSPQLKPCFLCLAFFEEDYSIPTKRLVNIWVAQGLIQQEGSSTIDEIAEGYLNELINRSMLQIQDLTIDGPVQYCHLHDLLRKVCLSKAEDEMGVKIVKGEEGVSSESSYKPRHCVVYGKNLETLSSKQNKHLRSLSLLNVSGDSTDMRTPSGYWKSFQLLKILDLDGCGFQTLPLSVRFLLGLKYLRMRRDLGNSSFRALSLPSWFDHLKKLEIFEVDFVSFPKVALQMERLRHFHAFGMYGKPMRIENWEKIESLKGIRLKDLLAMSSTIMAISHLRELSITLKRKKGDDKLSKGRALLEKMTNLVDLHLQFENTGFHDPVDSFEKLIPNLDNLTRLKLSGGKFSSPAASVLPSNLSHLTLDGIEYDPMEELGKLPKLLYLTLSGIWEENGRGWRMKVLHDGFPCLNTLSLKHMVDLRGIDIEEGGLPQLKQLLINACPKLQTENVPKHIIILAA